MPDHGIPNHSTHRRDRIATLVAVLLLTVVVVPLILPLFSDARIPARRAICLSQQRNVSTAIHSYSAANNGRLPMLRGTEIENDADPDNALYVTGWVTALLPFIEQQALHDRLLALDAAANQPGSGESFDTLAAVSIQVFVCPDSAQAEQSGALSYVANMGYMTADLWDNPRLAHRHQVSGTYNWNNGEFGRDSAEDAQVSRATGVFLYDPGGAPNTLDEISDGTSQTIVLAENINAGPWISGHPHDIGFAVRIGGTAERMLFAADSPQGLGGGTMETALRFHSVNGAPRIDLGPSAIGAPADRGRRTVPRPSSHHQGGDFVNVFFADGSGRSISSDIDPTVYARLVSSAGERHGQGSLSHDDF